MQQITGNELKFGSGIIAQLHLTFKQSTGVKLLFRQHFFFL